MYIPEITLHAATTLQQAAELMKHHAPRARLLAGGTDVLVDLKTGRISAEHLISITRISDLRGIVTSDDGLRLGALTTISELNAHPLVARECPALLDASQAMAAEQVRNAATIGGNIASAVPCADLPPILMTLHAVVETWSPTGRRALPLESFFLGPRATMLNEDELVIAVLVPPAPAGCGAAYERFALRAGNAIAVAAVAVSVIINDEGKIGQARIALGAVAPCPVLATAAGDILCGAVPSPATFQAAAAEAMAAAQPISDVRGSAEYRRELVGILTTRALQRACARATEVQP